MSKIGLHVVIGPRTGYGDFLRRLHDANAVSSASPMVVKCVGDFGPALEAKQVLGADRVLAIGRRAGEGWEGLDVHAEGGTPPRDVAALHFKQVYEPVVKANPSIDVWEPSNEWSAHWSWQADFYIELMPLFEAAGKRIGMFAASTGNPPEPAYTPIVRACAAAKERNKGHVLTLHEYGGVGVSIPTLRNTQPYHALRYRTLYERLKQENAVIPLVVSEAGQNAGYEFVGVDAFVADLAWYDAELFKDSYVLGCAAWTLGNWAPANFQEALPALAEYVVNTPTPTTQPEPEPTPARPRGAPRTQYKRVYDVVPQDASEVRATAIFREAWLRGKETVGGSYDDAGVGDLDTRVARLYDIPVERRAEFVAWYAQHYPGVIVEFA